MPTTRHRPIPSRSWWMALAAAAHDAAAARREADALLAWPLRDGREQGSLLGGVTWREVKPDPTYFDNVIGKDGTTVNTLADGLDDQGRHWGALVTVSVGKKNAGFTPVTVLRSTVLVSEQGEPLYANSLLWGRTFRLKPEEGSVGH